MKCRLVCAWLICAFPLWAWGKRPPYIHSPEESRAYVLKYCRVECQENSTKPRLPYCATFEKALNGDFRALDTVFSDKNYHTTETHWDWNYVPWHILQVIGDARYADFVLSHSPKERSEFLAFGSGGPAHEIAFQAYFRKRFPRTYVLYMEMFQPWPESSGFDYGPRRLSEALAAQPRFRNVRLYKRVKEKEKTLIAAPKNLSKGDRAALRALIQRHLGNNAKLVFR